MSATQTLAPSATVPLPSSSPTVLSNCNAFGSWTWGPTDVAPPYCAYNHNTTIPNLSSCCKEGAEVRVWRGCVQYCEVAEQDQEAWKECVIDVFPESDVEGHGFPCYFGDKNDFRDDADQSTTGTATPTGGVAEQSEAASAEDDEGAANVDQPSLTLVGWMVAFLAVGAGFMT